MRLVFNRRGLWVFTGVLWLLAIATGHGELGLAAVIAAITIIELLTWMGPLVGGRDAGRDRNSTR